MLVFGKILMPSNLIFVCLIVSVATIQSRSIPDTGTYAAKQTDSYDSYAKLNSVGRAKGYSAMTPNERMELSKERASRWLAKYAVSLEPGDSTRLKDTVSVLVPSLFDSTQPGSIAFPNETLLSTYLANALNVDGDYLPHSELKTDVDAVFDAAPIPADPIEQIHRSERDKAWNRRLPGKGMPLTEGKIVKHVDRIITAPFFSFEKCSHVILGTIVQQQPYLSEDKTAIYTEFKVRVEEIFKNDPAQVLNAGEDILVEREGGKLKLATGQIVELPVYGNGTIPRLGGRYLFSLTPWNGALMNRQLLLRC